MSATSVSTERSARLAGLPPLRLRRLSSIRLLGGHRLSLRFRDGFIGELDLLPWLAAERGPMSDPLLDERVFEQVFLDDGVLTWSHGFDIDPTTLRLWAEDGWCRQLPFMHPTTLALIRAAIEEDVGSGDVTSQYFIPELTRSKAKIMAKEAGVLSGIEIALEVFRQLDKGLGIWARKADGDAFEIGDVILEVEGRTRSILTAERTALNFLQRLSGIATTTRRYLDAVKPHPVKLLDTRKTTPGWRLLEKAAVKDGGGTNHRIGLYDQVMVKDNHHMACGQLDALQSAIDRVRKDRPGIKVQLEAASLEQVADFLALRGVDMILLDNMSVAELRQAVQINEGRVFLEASGGITLDTIKDVAATGVDAISVGALTHSSKAVDLSLEVL